MYEEIYYRLIFLTEFKELFFMNSASKTNKQTHTHILYVL